MRPRTVLAMILISLAATGCVDRQTAFQAWDVSSGGVPDYEFSVVGQDEPGTVFSVQIVDPGWTETQAKQVAADVVEPRRDDYAAIVVRFVSASGDRVAGYARDASGAQHLQSGGFLPGEVAEQGFPFLGFIQTGPAPEGASDPSGQEQG